MMSISVEYILYLVKVLNRLVELYSGVALSSYSDCNVFLSFQAGYQGTSFKLRIPFPRRAEDRK